MVEEGVVKRAEIRINTPTILNIPASSKLENIKSKYPKVQIQQHKYAPNGYYLIFNNANNTKAIVYEYYEMHPNKALQLIRESGAPIVAPLSLSAEL